MSYTSEHHRMRPVLDLARALDIAGNPDPAALYEAGSGGFQVWCTPQDHPRGWEDIRMQAGAFSKPCEYVGSVHWKWEDEAIVAVQIETCAYALMDQKPDEYGSHLEPADGDPRATIHNRPDDLAWLAEKVAWLFEKAGIPLPPLVHEPLPENDPPAFQLAHYLSEGDEYVVIVSPDSDPQDFCRPGYQLFQTLPIWNADDFPTDMPLRPDEGQAEPAIEPDEGPLVEQYENATRLGDDGWLEAAFEDSISGWEE